MAVPKIEIKLLVKSPAKLPIKLPKISESNFGVYLISYHELPQITKKNYRKSFRKKKFSEILEKFGIEF